MSVPGQRIVSIARWQAPYRMQVFGGSTTIARIANECASFTVFMVARKSQVIDLPHQYIGALFSQINSEDVCASCRIGTSVTDVFIL